MFIFPLRYFPVDFLVRKLEVFSSKVGAEHSWVFKALLDIGFSLPKILDVYNRYSCAEFSDDIELNINLLCSLSATGSTSRTTRCG